MTRAVLTATEARAHAEGTLTEIRRPFDEANDSVPADFRARFGGAPDAASAVFPDGSGKGWIAWWTTAPVTAEQTARLYPGAHGIVPALGQPGTVLDDVVRITAVRVERAAAGWEWVYGVEKAS